MSERKVRCDAIIEGLPEEQRDKVDGWLLDKGLTYQQVATACMTLFGVKVSRSSVGRYYERKMKELLDQEETTLDMAKSGRFGESQELIRERIEELALDYIERRWDEEKWSLRALVRLVKMLLASRKQKLQEEKTRVEREAFEKEAAKAVWEYYRGNERKGHETRRRGGRKDPDEPWEFYE